MVNCKCGSRRSARVVVVPLHTCAKRNAGISAWLWVLVLFCASQPRRGDLVHRSVRALRPCQIPPVSVRWFWRYFRYIQTNFSTDHDEIFYAYSVRLSKGLSSHPVGVENSPWNKLTPPWKGPSTSPVRRSTCFDDQLTRPLHANLLLQHETEGIHTTKN